MTTLTYELPKRDYQVVDNDFIINLVEMRWNLLLVPIVEVIMAFLSPLLYYIYVFKVPSLPLTLQFIPLVTSIMLSIDAIFIQFGYYLSRGVVDFIKFVFTGEF